MLRHLPIGPRHFTLSLQQARKQFSSRLYSQSREIEEDDSDVLDISRFGRYNLVLPDDPTREGVSHITPMAVPSRIKVPPYALRSGSSFRTGVDSESIIRLGGEEEAYVRWAGLLAGRTLAKASEVISTGVTTKHINSLVHDFIIANSAYPSPLLYNGFPMSCCTSVNNIIVHGIPDDRPLEDGDIVNVDVTVYLDGYHGDTSQTFLVGTVDNQGRDLVQSTNDALHAAISICGPGTPFKEIGKVIEELAASRGFSVSSQFSGHGIGKEFHQPPWISHVVNEEEGIMKPGHCFTIEPSLVQGDDPRGWMLPDGWTVLTETGARSAAAEHTVLITEKGVDVLTAWRTS